MRFLGIFNCYRPECAIWLFPKNLGLQDSNKKTFFERFTGNLKKEWLAFTILNPVFVKSVKLLGILHCYRPECAIWLFPKNVGLRDSDKKKTFFERFTGNLKKEWLTTTILNPAFVKSAQFLGIFRRYRRECAIWLFPKICGTPGFTKKKENIFRKVHGQFKERMIGNHNPESGFCQKCEVFGIFRCYRPECAIWLFPNFAGLQDSQKKLVFRRVFKKQFKQRIWQTQSWIQFLSKVWGSWAFFIAIAQNVPSDCSQNLRDSRILRKDRFSKGSRAIFKKEWLATTNPESSFCQKCAIFWHFSLLSPRMRHLIVP